MRVKSAMLLRILSCALLFWLFAQSADASDIDEAVFPESKLGRNVLFPGIDEPVRVAALESAAGVVPDKLDDVLPVKVLDSIIRARDRNARWLVCERRTDYVSFSYTYVFENYSKRAQPTRGRYDRGVYLKLPSEFVLYYGDWRAYEYKDEEGYFKIKLKPDGKPEKGKDKERHFIPNYLDWASIGQMVQPIAWMTERWMAYVPLLRDTMDYQYGFELWFGQRDLRLLRELITVPTEVIGDDGTVHLDTDNPTIVKEVHYRYYSPDDDYPTEVTIIRSGYISAELRFQFIDGFWVLDRGLCYTGSDRSKFSIGTRDVSVER